MNNLWETVERPPIERKFEFDCNVQLASQRSSDLDCTAVHCRSAMSRRSSPPRKKPLPESADEPISAAGEGDVGQLIRQLPPSQDLLEYYRNKTDQFQQRLEKLAESLDT